MDATAGESIAADLRAWSQQYARGEVRVVQLVKPRLETGEKWAVRTLQVGHVQARRDQLASQSSAMSTSTTPSGRSRIAPAAPSSGSRPRQRYR